MFPEVAVESQALVPLPAPGLVEVVPQPRESDGALVLAHSSNLAIVLDPSPRVTIEEDFRPELILYVLGLVFRVSPLVGWC